MLSSEQRKTQNLLLIDWILIGCTFFSCLFFLNRQHQPSRKTCTWKTRKIRVQKKNGLAWSWESSVVLKWQIKPEIPTNLYCEWIGVFVAIDALCLWLKLCKILLLFSPQSASAQMNDEQMNIDLLESRQYDEWWWWLNSILSCFFLYISMPIAKRRWSAFKYACSRWTEMSFLTRFCRCIAWKNCVQADQRGYAKSHEHNFVPISMRTTTTTEKNRQCVCECTVFHANIKLEFAWSYVETKLQIQQNTNRCKNNKNGTIYWIINAENIKLINTRNGVTGDVGESIDCLFILSRQTHVKVAYNERWMLPNNWLQKASRIVFSLSPQSI